MTLPNVLFWVAIAGAVVSFYIYFRVTVTPPAHDEVKQAIKDSAANVRGLTTVSAGEIADLLKALASLVDSLVKAGPALWSLIGSILFLLVASIAAGLIGGKLDAPPAPQTKTQTTETTNVQAPANGAQATNEDLPVKNER